MRSVFVLFFILPSLLVPAAEGKLRYLPADPDSPLLRRDLLPLDIDSIHQLADHLTTLAEGPFPKTAPSLRSRAMALTLAQRLHPEASRARDLEDDLLAQKDRPSPPAQKRQAARTFIFEYADWLVERPPGSEGRLLGQLLLDFMKSLGIDHRLVRAHESSKARDRWGGVLANPGDFVIDEDPKPRPPPVSFDSRDRKYATTALLTDVPMRCAKVGSAFPVEKLVPTSLVITPATAPPADTPSPEPAPPGKLIFKPEPDLDVEALHRDLLAFFKTHREELPEGFNLNVNTDKRRYLAGNQDNIRAPLALLLDSASTGRGLLNHTIFMARLEWDGSLQKPAMAWELLLALQEEKRSGPTRLVVGPGLQEELTGLLVLDHPSFFTRFEVIEASTYEEALPLLLEGGKMVTTLESACKRYREICEKASRSTSLGRFLSNAAVEKRLVEASNFSTRHLSAKMLATHADRRPALFSRVMAARDLDRRLEPLSHFRYDPALAMDRQLALNYEKTRDLLAPLEDRLTLSERELWKEAMSLNKKFRSIGPPASTDSDRTEQIWQRDIQDFQEKLAIFRQSLREIHSPNSGKNQ